MSNFFMGYISSGKPECTAKHGKAELWVVPLFLEKEGLRGVA
jgi:hypothetical protein